MAAAVMPFILRPRRLLTNINRIQEERTPAPKEVQDRYTAFGFADLGVDVQNAGDWHCLLRNVQGVVALPHILDGTLTHLVDSTEFEEDDLSCEWSYFVDWEGRLVHVKGGGREGSVGFKEVSVEWMERVQKEANEEDVE